MSTLAQAQWRFNQCGTTFIAINL
ncbi:hypothetical protein CLUP02_07100 [Colletotrichum lupini]|uniref:Uncharacterized protein n=1 Tax=Colletotrichum lupini TaxID=145971 RepID=A0A9Q8SQC7_9PEZI|nr:hypothetical protein CLUP02_07100 [Colletotrichum lupini]